MEVLWRMDKEEPPSICEPPQTAQTPGDQTPFSQFNVPVEALGHVEPCTKKFDLSGTLGDCHDKDLLDGEAKEHINEARSDAKEFHIVTNRGETWHESMSGCDQLLAMLTVTWIFFIETHGMGLVKTNLDELGLLRVELLFNQFVFHCVAQSCLLTTKAAKFTRAKKLIPSFNAEQMKAHNVMKDEHLHQHRS